MKACFKCGRSLPLTEFYAQPKSLDGRDGKCKECAKADARRNYRLSRLDPEQVAKERKRSREKNLRLGYSEKYRGKSQKYSRDWRQLHPEKIKAQAAVNNAVRAGRLTRPKVCQECGTGGRIAGHHPDYSKPLEVVWLCFRCHMRRHWKDQAS